VTRTAGGKEVWRDERTELLWGDYIANDTWCKATGNGEVDPSGYCTGNTQSYCAEGGSRIKALAGEDWTTGVYDATKGGMGAVATASSPSVRWRLPTRNDWYIAEADGIRYVLPNMLYSFWSATVYSNARVNAWVFDGYVGGMNLDNRSNSNSVRCLGR
jgi:hypothetical protein